MKKVRVFFFMKIQSPIGTTGHSISRIDKYIIYLLNADMYWLNSWMSIWMNKITSSHSCEHCQHNPVKHAIIFRWKFRTLLPYSWSLLKWRLTSYHVYCAWGDATEPWQSFTDFCLKIQKDEIKGIYIIY